jgi:hypothetical protein
LATYPCPQSSSSSSDPVFHTAYNTPLSSVPPTEDSIPWQSNIQGIQNLMGATWVATYLLFLFPFFFLLRNLSINNADLFALMEPYTYHLHLHPSHLSTPTLNHSRTFQVLHLPRLPPVLHLHTPAHPNTSRRILSFPSIHCFLAFFPNSRCLFDRRIITFLPDPSGKKF